MSASPVNASIGDEVVLNRRMSKPLAVCVALFLAAVLVESGRAQQALTWPELRDRFEALNPTLIAGGSALTSPGRLKSRPTSVPIPT